MDDIILQQAMIYFERAYRAQMKGELSTAIELYRKSLDVHPTAEAHTFLGWTYSMLNRHEDAIAECERAIEIDPDFGNPYNDIGSYLIQLGRPDEALTWLEKATHAPRYEAPQYPHTNMGRAYEMSGRYRSALQAYDRALEVDPFYMPARWAKYALLGKMN